MARLATLREEIRQPLPLAYHPFYRFYEGGSLTRRFRGLPDRPDDWPDETFGLPASLPFRVQAGPEPVRVVRCLGPIVE